MQKEMEELERAEREEEEAKKWEEERIRKEVEELEEFRRKEREACERQKIAFEKAKAEKVKRQTLEESDEIGVTVGSFLEEKGVTWGTKEGKVCTSCRKAEKKCFWRTDPAQGKACYACTVSKKICKLGGVEQESEPGPLKRRKATESKGKGKEKIGVPVVSGSMTLDVWEMILSELRGMKEEVVSELWGLRTEVAEVGSETCKVRLNCEFLAQQVKAINFNVRDLANHFNPVQYETNGAMNEDEGAGQGSAKNTENTKNERTEIEETLQ